MSMSNFFDWNLIEKVKSSGTSKLKCPACHDTRKNKADRSLYVNFNSGVAKCFNCEALSFRDSEKTQKEVKYTLPLNTWRNYTILPEAMVKYCESRKVAQFVLNELKITYEQYFQPAINKEVGNIVFNYFEGDVLVNKKYRTANKKFTQSKNGKPIFYNINSVIGKDEVYIVEGEFDVLALTQIGVKNCISVPNGANDNDAYWINSEKYLKDVKKFFIAVDNDEKGNDLAEKIAQRLGRWRCERVLFNGKDANDDLISGVLEKTIYNTQKYPVSGTFTVNDLYDNILNLYDNGLPETISPKHPCFGNIKDVFSVMRGHLITGTGIPSHGKSNFTEWYVLNLIAEYKMKASFFSPEHFPMELHHTSFIEKVFAKNFFYEYKECPKISKFEIAKYYEWANEKIYLTAPESNKFPTWEWIFEKFKEQVFTYGIDIFVIDAFNKLGFDKKGNKLDLIGEVLTKLTMFAQMNNVIVFLIAHPTKMPKDSNGLYNSPSLYDVSGSGDFRNQTHDGFSVYRFFGEEEEDQKTVFENLKTKMKFQGQIGGKVEFKYHKPSGRYYATGTKIPTHSLIDNEIKTEISEEEKQQIFINPQDAFDMNYNSVLEDENELPF